MTGPSGGTMSTGGTISTGGTRPSLGSTAGDGATKSNKKIRLISRSRSRSGSRNRNRPDGRKKTKAADSHSRSKSRSPCRGDRDKEKKATKGRGRSRAAAPSGGRSRSNSRASSGGASWIAGNSPLGSPSPEGRKRIAQQAVNTILADIKSKREAKDNPQWKPPENIVKGRLLELTTKAQLMRKHTSVLDTNAFIPNSAGIDLVGLNKDRKPRFYQCKNFKDNANDVVSKREDDAQRMIDQVGERKDKDDKPTQRSDGWKKIALKSRDDDFKKLIHQARIASDLNEHPTVRKVTKALIHVLPKDTYNDKKTLDATRKHAVASTYSTDDFREMLKLIPFTPSGKKKTEEEKDGDFDPSQVKKGQKKKK